MTHTAKSVNLGRLIEIDEKYTLPCNLIISGHGTMMSLTHNNHISRIITLKPPMIAAAAETEEMIIIIASSQMLGSLSWNVVPHGHSVSYF